jgi:hypothetical protein
MYMSFDFLLLRPLAQRWTKKQANRQTTHLFVNLEGMPEPTQYNYWVVGGYVVNMFALTPILAQASRLHKDPPRPPTRRIQNIASTKQMKRFLKSRDSRSTGSNKRRSLRGCDTHSRSQDILMCMRLQHPLGSIRAQIRNMDPNWLVSVFLWGRFSCVPTFNNHRGRVALLMRVFGCGEKEYITRKFLLQHHCLMIFHMLMRVML